MILFDFLISEKFKQTNPIQNVFYYTKTIGDFTYDVYPHTITTYIMVFDDNNETELIFDNQIEVINYLKKIIRQAKIKNILQSECHQ